MKIAGFKKIFLRTYRPTPQDCASVRASKISTDECINTGRSSTFKDVFGFKIRKNVKILLKIGRIM